MNMLDKILKEIINPIILKQIKTNQPPYVAEYYRTFLNQGISKDFIIEAFGYQFNKSFSWTNEEVFKMIQSEKNIEQLLNNLIEGNSDTYQDNLKALFKYFEFDSNAEPFSNAKADRFLRKLKKDLILPANFEDIYSDELFIFESNIQYYRVHTNITSSELRKVLVLMLIIMTDNHKKYYYDTYLSGNCYLLAFDLLPVILPNPKHFTKWAEQSNAEFELIQEKTLTLSFCIILKIIDSIDTWNKRFGSDGYFTYLDNIGFNKYCNWEKTNIFSDQSIQKLIKE